MKLIDTAARFPIVIDTREKIPLTFPSRRTLRRKLDIGDYSIRGLEKYLVVEYKSQNDWLSCISTQREHFCKQLAKLATVPKSIVIVGGNVYNKNWGAYKEWDVIHHLMRLQVYRIPIIFVQSRERAEYATKEFLDYHGGQLRRGLFQTLKYESNHLLHLSPIISAIENSGDKETD